MRLDLGMLTTNERAQVRAWATRISDDPDPDEETFFKVVLAAGDRGEADLPAPQTARAARVWRLRAHHLAEMIRNELRNPGVANGVHALVVGLDDHARELEKAGELGSEARLKYGLPSGEGEIVPESKQP